MKTIVEYAKGLPDSDRSKPLVEMFASETDIWGALPIDGIEGAVYEYFRSAALPGVAFRGINEASSTGTGKISPGQEPTYIFDHDLDVDRAIVDRYGPLRRHREEALAAAAAGRLWVDTFLKGDNTANPRVFNGLQKRSATFGRTVVNNAASGGGALSLAKLDTAIVNTYKPTHIIADYSTQPLWIAAARTQALTGFVAQTWDEVGKVKMSYAGLPILWGYPRDDQGSLLPFTEVGAGGGAAQCTSIYIVSFRDGGLKGIQLKPLRFMEMGTGGLLPDGITYRTHMSWDVGIVDEHKYCLTRLSSITNAAIVA